MVKYSGAHEEAVFTALADPSRRWLLRRLTGRTRSTSELAAGLDMSMPAVLKHLRVLERSRLISRAKSGRTCFYQLQPRGLVPAEKFLDGLRRFWNDRFDELERHLAAPPPPTSAGDQP
jgi:DNA-binding transcriptional ArsR family regulator